MLARQPPQPEPAPQDSATARAVQAPLRARRRISRSVTAWQLQTIKSVFLRAGRSLDQLRMTFNCKDHGAYPSEGTRGTLSG